MGMYYITVQVLAVFVCAILNTKGPRSFGAEPF